ncbi:MAG: hypothetical protein NC517_05925 [Firmicutes bacterium]|nr:hypothetical protein [Bacillota bacterium]
MSYLSLTKRIMQNELTNEELVECLNIPNVPVLQQTMLKLIERNVQNADVHIKLLEYSNYMDNRFKILGLCKIGHLAVYALKRLGYIEDFSKIYEELPDEDKEQIAILEQAFV